MQKRVRVAAGLGLCVAAVRYSLRRHAFGRGNFDEPLPRLGGLRGPRQNPGFALGLWNAICRDEANAFDFRQTDVLAPTQWQRAVGLETAWHAVMWVLEEHDPEGHGELRVPVGPDNRPALQRIMRVGDLPLHRIDGEKVPHAELHAARFEPGSAVP